MSAKLYAKLWLATKEELKDVLLREKVIQNIQPEKERAKAHVIFASIFVRYVQIVNNLGNIYDQTLQVQKREIVLRILVAATKRMQDLQNELKAIEMSEFLYVDQTFLEQKFIPQDIQLLCPYYNPLRRPPEIQDIIDGKRAKEQEEEVDPDYKKTVQYMIELAKKKEAEEAAKYMYTTDFYVNQIKRHEKARQARCLLKNITLHPKIYKPVAPPLDSGPKYDFYHKEDQAMLIQIKRTSYRTNFEREHKTISHVKYYGEPDIVHESKDDLKVVDQNIEEFNSKSTESIKIHEAEKSERKIRRNEAATKIQRYFLRYQIKKLVSQRKYKHLLNIGMIDERKWDFSEKNKIIEQREHNRRRKKEFDERFIQVIQDEKNRIVKFRAPWIMEDISDHIRNWFREMYDAAGDFDAYPPELKGGTILVIRGETKTPQEFSQFLRDKTAMAAMTKEERKKIQDNIKKEKNAEMAKKKAVKLLEKKKAAQKKAQALKEGKTWDFTAPEFITKNYITLDNTVEEFEREWRFIDEFANLKEEPYLDWINIDNYAELHQELRIEVDKLMRVEYELLKQALSLDKRKKYAPSKPPRERKKKKDKKPKQVPDPFDGKSFEIIYDEMIQAGVVYTYPKRNLDDYIGDMNYAAYELRNMLDQDPRHFMGEIKNVLRNWTLGMGPVDLAKPRSICIAGPPMCGKRFLLHALATELDAIILNISPKVVVQFESNIKKFLDVVFKVAQVAAPCILYMNGAHNSFIKKIPPESKNDNPKLIAKFLLRKMKQIKPLEKIMLIGVTNEPWNCALGRMKKLYEKCILCPGTDYSTSFLTWRAAILDKFGTDCLMDFSALAKVTKWYGTNQILENVNTVVDLKRRVHIPVKPLKAEELLEGLLLGPVPNFPMTQLELEKYWKWFGNANKYQKMRKKYQTDQTKGVKKK